MDVLSNNLDYSRSESCLIAYRRQAIRAGVAVSILVGLLMALYALTILQGRRRGLERAGFDRLSELAIQMVGDSELGVSANGGDSFISSFDAFYAYVAKKRPDAVAARDASNPFPGFLPPGDYGHRLTPATNGADILLWRKDIRHERVGQIQLRMTATGRVLDLVTPSGSMKESGPP